MGFAALKSSVKKRSILAAIQSYGNAKRYLIYRSKTKHCHSCVKDKKESALIALRKYSVGLEEMQGPSVRNQTFSVPVIGRGLRA